MTELHIPKTLHESMKHFADPQVCHNFLMTLRWPDGVTCPYCKGKEHSFISTRRVWFCKTCKKRFSLKNGTIMEESPLKLETWIAGMWPIVNAKNGISSCEVSRALGITQKTAWFLLHRIRHIMQTGSLEPMTGPVEVDETFIGGKEKNKHEHKKLKAGRGAVGKEIVMGILERGGDVRVKHIPNTEKETLQGEIKKNVEAGADVYTDALISYRGLSPDFKHAWVDHAVGYVEGKVHTNGIENFWSLFDRMLMGTYTHVDPRHLPSYLDEESNRFNNRKEDDRARFAMAAASISGKRLTYKKLTERGLTTMAPEED